MVFVKGAEIDDNLFPFDPRFREYFCCPDGHLRVWSINGKLFNTCGIAPTGKVSTIDGNEYQHERRLEVHPNGHFVVRPDWCPLKRAGVP